MPGSDTHTRTLRLGGLAYRIRSPAALQQFADPDKHAQLLGISSAQWSLFGHVWPAGRLLAEAMVTHDVAGQRNLEIGWGLGIASLVLGRRGVAVDQRGTTLLSQTVIPSTTAPNELTLVALPPLAKQH